VEKQTAVMALRLEKVLVAVAVCILVLVEDLQVTHKTLKQVAVLELFTLGTRRKGAYINGHT
jgi:hypothetical protein